MKLIDSVGAPALLGSVHLPLLLLHLRVPLLSPLDLFATGAAVCWGGMCSSAGWCGSHDPCAANSLVSIATLITHQCAAAAALDSCWPQGNLQGSDADCAKMQLAVYNNQGSGSTTAQHSDDGSAVLLSAAMFLAVSASHPAGGCTTCQVPHSDEASLGLSWFDHANVAGGWLMARVDRLA